MTPNNFLGVYRIRVQDNVTIQLSFLDLTVAGANCEDFLLVRFNFGERFYFNSSISNVVIFDLYHLDCIISFILYISPFVL